MIQKCFFGWPGNSTLKYDTKTNGKSTREALTCDLQAAVSCVAWKNHYVNYIKTCTFCRPDIVSSRMQSVIQTLSIWDQQAKLELSTG